MILTPRHYFAPRRLFAQRSQRVLLTYMIEFASILAAGSSDDEDEGDEGELEWG